MTWRAAVIGAGNIAQGFDNPHDETILTHVKGYQRNPAFELTAIHDVDTDRLDQAARRWKIPHACRELEEIFRLDPEVISICTPDHTHHDLLLRCLQSRAKLVFCEKPVCRNAAEVSRLIRLYRESGKSLAVNYSRRWVPAIMRIRPKSTENYGKLLSVRIKYYRGFFHNCSHLIDLLSAFAQPELKGGLIISSITDFLEADKTITAACRLDSPFGEFSLMIEGYDGRKMAPLELELIFEQKRFLLEELDGTRLTEASLRPDTLYPEWLEFSETMTVAVASEQALGNALRNIADHLSTGTPLAADAETVLATMRLCEQIYSLDHLQP